MSRLRSAGCVFAEEEALLLVTAAASGSELESLLTRRAAGEPLEYLLGWAQFSGLRIRVGPGVFIPRRRTEFLAAAVVDFLREQAERGGGAAALVVELCCGSGAISAAVAAAVPSARLHAADLSADAAGYARLNLGARAAVYQGDLFAALPHRLRGSTDLVVANAPYVPTERLVFMPREARLHEPADALDGGEQGLKVLGRIAAEAPAWLRPGGRLFVECSTGQVPALTAVFTAAGLRPEVLREEKSDATVLSGLRC
ncbi:putative protein N(5)-glutamine methyltransferase [Arthrobacter pullicola]|uniref:putative protein N(5)-glutamine methyltransferase n=1 Tax=Arthrobacter pullicola TaxID=2762224 RepID=UPI00296AEB30|nr:putative protein N(5)-glutamine methyltransferase [Arthrobacter pullicola]